MGNKKRKGANAFINSSSDESDHFQEMSRNNSFEIEECKQAAHIYSVSKMWETDILDPQWMEQSLV